LDTSFGLARVTITSILSDTVTESFRALIFVVCFARDSDTCVESVRVFRTKQAQHKKSDSTNDDDSQLSETQECGNCRQSVF
jgi:hypothetical protein